MLCLAVAGQRDGSAFSSWLALQGTLDRDEMGKILQRFHIGDGHEGVVQVGCALYAAPSHVVRCTLAANGPMRGV